MNENQIASYGPSTRFTAIIQLQRELESLRPLYGVLNAVRVAIKQPADYSAGIVADLRRLLPRIEEVLKAAEAAHQPKDI